MLCGAFLQRNLYNRRNKCQCGCPKKNVPNPKSIYHTRSGDVKWEECDLKFLAKSRILKRTMACCEQPSSIDKTGEGEWPCHRYSVVHVPLANEGYVTKTWKERWMRNGGQNTYMQNLVLWKWDLHVTHGHINRISFLLATVICNWSWGHENWHARTLMLRDRNRAESYMQRLQNFGIWESFLH